MADVPFTVLITGETGAGKEFAAEALHYRRANRDKPLVMVVCSALSESLIESELFGHSSQPGGGGACVQRVIDKKDPAEVLPKMNCTVPNGHRFMNSL